MSYTVHILPSYSILWSLCVPPSTSVCLNDGKTHTQPPPASPRLAPLATPLARAFGARPRQIPHLLGGAPKPSPAYKPKNTLHVRNQIRTLSPGPMELRPSKPPQKSRRGSSETLEKGNHALNGKSSFEDRLYSNDEWNTLFTM